MRENVFLFERQLTEARIKISYTHPFISGNHIFLVNKSPCQEQVKSGEFTSDETNIQIFLHILGKFTVANLHTLSKLENPKKTHANAGRTCEIQTNTQA